MKSALLGLRRSYLSPFYFYTFVLHLFCKCFPQLAYTSSAASECIFSREGQIMEP